jgi:hypothetical protein
MNLEIFMLSGTSQAQKVTYHMVLIIRDRIQIDGYQRMGGVNGEGLILGWGLLLG